MTCTVVSVLTYDVDDSVGLSLAGISFAAAVGAEARETVSVTVVRARVLVIVTVLLSSSPSAGSAGVVIGSLLRGARRMLDAPSSPGRATAKARSLLAVTPTMAEQVPETSASTVSAKAELRCILPAFSSNLRGWSMQRPKMSGQSLYVMLYYGMATP